MLKKTANGKVSYKDSGSFTDVDDGNGDSDFFVNDAFAFRISDGAGDDTIIVDGGNGVINLGDGTDTVRIESGLVDIFDFVPGEDTLLIGASYQLSLKLRSID